MCHLCLKQSQRGSHTHPWRNSGPSGAKGAERSPLARMKERVPASTEALNVQRRVIAHTSAFCISIHEMRCITRQEEFSLAAQEFCQVRSYVALTSPKCLVLCVILTCIRYRNAKSCNTCYRFNGVAVKTLPRLIKIHFILKHGNECRCFVNVFI